MPRDKPPHASCTHLNNRFAARFGNIVARSGALKSLKNIILLPGCGQFVPGASFVLHEPGSDELAAAALTSEVSPRVGHTPQICVLPPGDSWTS